MAYSELLADRVRQILADKSIGFLEKKMMGGLCFMVDGKMCMGVVKEDLMARIGPDAQEAALDILDAADQLAQTIPLLEPATDDILIDIGQMRVDMEQIKLAKDSFNAAKLRLINSPGDKRWEVYAKLANAFIL